MALTINTHPAEVITNAPEFNVTTSLVESASIQNLRIRATIYQGGESEAVAVLEQPKNLDDWNLFDLLKSLTGKLNTPADGSDFHASPTLGSELLSAWSNVTGLFETFTVSGREITSAIDSNASGGIAGSNDLGAGSVGDLYVVGLEDDYDDSGAADFVLKLTDGLPGNVKALVQYAGLSSDKLIENHIYFLLLTEAEAATYILLQSVAGSNGNLAGTATVHKITDYKNNPGVYFSVKFEEVYEDANNVTQIGAESWSDTLLFVSVIVRPNEDFNDFILNTISDEWLSRTILSEQKYKIGIGMEMRIMYVTTNAYVIPNFYKDEVLTTGSTEASAGWGIFIVFDGVNGLSDSNESFRVGLGTVKYTDYQYLEKKCFPDMSVLSFVGALGEETSIFRGLPTEAGGVEKSFIKNVNHIRKVLKAYKRTVEVLRTLYETEETRRLLYELVYTELPVWMYDADFTDGFREVTVLNDDTPIKNQNQLIESEIEVEYYE